MDEGSGADLAARFDRTQISAVQYAMDLYYRDRQAFQSEYQNDPISREVSSTMRLTPNEICERINGTERAKFRSKNAAHRVHRHLAGVLVVVGLLVRPGL